MPDMNALMGVLKSVLPGDGPQKKAAPVADDYGDGTDPSPYNDEEILELWKRIKRESIDNDWVWDRQHQRNIWYILGRQWIEYLSQHGGWREKRMAPTIPRPVTNVCKDTLRNIRSIFQSINIGVNVRPNGSEPANVSAAAVADELSPVIHEAHGMTRVMGEFDFWLISTGNAFLHTFVDYDIKNGTIAIDYETCTGCGEEVPTHTRLQPNVPCKTCGATEFQPTMDAATGQPKQTHEVIGKPTTIALSKLEVAFPNSLSSFGDIPYIVRKRWRTKWYFEQHPTLKDLVPNLTWSKAPADKSLALFKSLATQNDLGVMPTYMTDGGAGEEDGISEFEVQMKPCDKYPEGLVFRVIGDQAPQLLHLEDSESVPGPLPYKDAEGKPLFTWTHAGYDPVGGRIIASGPIDLIIQKQDQLNQLDSMVMMTLMRLAAGGWIIPKGSEIENVTKMSTPGIIVRWNPLTVQGNAKPERFEGAQINESWFTYREQILGDIEKLTGTYDIIKGAKPTGVEAFSALQLLVERGQSSFATVFTARGEAYKDWFKFALELEREFGPGERTKAVLSPARTWTFKKFQRTQLQGSVAIVVEDGSNTPKTSLGLRAAVQQAQALMMLDMKNSDTVYEGLKMFGLTRMVPTLDIHIQAALAKQQAFEEWIIDPQAVQGALQEHTDAFTGWQQKQSQQLTQQTVPGMTPPIAPPPSPMAYTPLKWKPWYKAAIHKQEFEKWANSDRIRELIQQNPAAEELLAAHYAEIKQNDMMDQMMAAGGGMMAQPGQKPGGAGMAMENSNNESTQHVQPKEKAAGTGPA